MRALITGGTGFIGRNLIRHLCQRGDYCRVLARPSSDVRPLEKLDVEIQRADITEPATLRQAAEGIDVVFHLAATGHVSTVSQADLAMFRAVNVEGTRNLVHACLASGVDRVVHFSSTAAMGLIRRSPINEHTSCNPVTPYQRSKWEGERLVLDACDTGRLRGVVLRPCMVYGPGGYGEFARFCRWFSKGVFPRVGLGANLTPLVHVQDVVRAAYLAATVGGVGQVYLIASETSLPLADLRAMVIETLGVQRPYLYAPRWLAMLGAGLLEGYAALRGVAPLATRANIASVTASRVFDIGAARQDLGYRPQVSFEDGVRETVQWYRQEGWL